MIQIIKKIIKKIFLTPRGLKHFGKNSTVAYPYTFGGKKFISIGNNFNMRKYGHIIAIEQYEGKTYSPNISIGNDVYIGGNVHIHAIEEVIIEDGCVLSEFVYISDLAHGFHPDKGLIMKQDLEKKGKVHIHKNVFIGLHCCILPNVTLGEHCIVGTGSVVTKSFPAYSVIAGNPAKMIKRYDLERKEWRRTDAKGEFIGE